MSASIRLFPQFNPYELPVRWGKAHSSAVKAIAKAKTPPSAWKSGTPASPTARA